MLCCHMATLGYDGVYYNFFSEPGLKISEASDKLFGPGGHEVEAVFMEPPEPAILTDKDSGDESDRGTPDYLCRNQLEAKAEIVYSGINDPAVEVPPIPIKFTGKRTYIDGCAQNVLYLTTPVDFFYLISKKYVNICKLVSLINKLNMCF